MQKQQKELNRYLKWGDENTFLGNTNIDVHNLIALHKLAKF